MIKTKRIIIIFLVAVLLIPYSYLFQVNKVNALTLSAPNDFKVEAHYLYNKLSWTNNDNDPFVYTLIQRSTDQGDFYTIAYVNKSTKHYVDWSVSNGHIYRYRAITYTGIVMSPYTPEIEAITLYPTSFRIAEVYVGQINLEWSYPVLPLLRNPDYLTVIERRASLNSQWTTIATLPITESTYRDTDITTNSNYYYRIRTRYAKDRYSNYFPNEYGVNTQTAFPLNSPLWAHGLPDGNIRLEWDMSMAEGGSAYLEKKSASGDFYPLADTYFSYYIDVGTLAGETYTYRMRMKSYNGTYSVYTDEISVTAEPVPIPADLTCTAYDGEKIDLSWYYPYGDETGFEIWRKSDKLKWELIATVPRNTEAYSDYSSMNGIAYSYKIRAKRGDKAFSNFSPYKNVINMFPDSPGEIVCYANQGLLFIYSKEATPKNTTYTLEYRKDINSQWENYKTVTNEVLIAHVGFSASSEYYFRIRANVGSLETVGPELHFFGSTPDAPRNLQIHHAGYKRVLLGWDHNTVKEKGYNIYRSVRKADGTLTRTLLGSVGKDAEYFTDTSPIEGGHVYYEVVAFNISGESKAAGLSTKIPVKKLYKDIAQYQWAHNSIYSLQGLGAFENVSNDYFSPQNIITRGQMAQMVIKSFNIPYDNSGLLLPADITPNHIYYKDIMTAIKLGLMHPEANGNIYPNKAVTRQEIILMLNSALGNAGLQLASHNTNVIERFTDYYQIAPEEVNIIASFVGEGIITGKSGQLLSLKTNTTKAEATVFIYQTLIKYKLYK